MTAFSSFITLPVRKAEIAWRTATVYAATKVGRFVFFQFTRSIAAKNWWNRGHPLNAVHPGPIDTPG